MNSKEFGKLGEEMAADYLNSQGYFILEKNWFFNKKEIDIICTKNNILVFIEVKSRQDTTPEDPSRAVTKTKKRFLIEAANAYIEKYDTDNEVRFDVITILLDKNGAPQLEHYESAIIPEI